MFVCFGAAASGFKFCQPILDLNGTHLKSKYLGILLSATSIDATSALFPIAHAVVDENVYETALRYMEKINSLSVSGLLEHADPQHWAEL